MTKQEMAFHQALINEDEEGVENGIKAGVDLNQFFVPKPPFDYYYGSPIRICFDRCIENRVDEIKSAKIVELLAKNGADIEDVDDDVKINLLMFAMNNNKFLIAQTLIQYGANVNHIAADGETCIFFAISNPWSRELVKTLTLLKDKGADFEQKIFSNGYPPIYYSDCVTQAQFYIDLGVSIYPPIGETLTPEAYLHSQGKHDAANFIASFRASREEGILQQYVNHPADAKNKRARM
jgi:hypothetical protein